MDRGRGVGLMNKDCDCWVCIDRYQHDGELWKIYMCKKEFK